MSDGQLTIAMTGGEKATKTIWVSECPGDKTKYLDGTFPVSMDGTAGRCVGEGFEVGVIGFSSRNPGTTVQFVCNLQVGKTYYANIKNAPFGNLSGNTCEGGTTCSYYRSFYHN